MLSESMTETVIAFEKINVGWLIKQQTPSNIHKISILGLWTRLKCFRLLNKTEWEELKSQSWIHWIQMVICSNWEKPRDERDCPKKWKMMWRLHLQLEGTSLWICTWCSFFHINPSNTILLRIACVQCGEWGAQNDEIDHSERSIVSPETLRSRGASFSEEIQNWLVIVDLGMVRSFQKSKKLDHIED
jgi:hypothetical protein